MVWGCCGFIALISSREEGGAVADLLFVGRRQQGQLIMRRQQQQLVLISPAILDVGLCKSSKRVV